MAPTADVAPTRPSTPIQPSASVQLAASVQSPVQTHSPLPARSSATTTTQHSASTANGNCDGFMPPSDLLNEEEEREFMHIVWALHKYDARDLRFKWWDPPNGRRRSSSAMLVDQEGHQVYKRDYEHGESGQKRERLAVLSLLRCIRQALEARENGFGNRADTLGTGTT